MILFRILHMLVIGRKMVSEFREDQKLSPDERARKAEESVARAKKSFDRNWKGFKIVLISMGCLFVLASLLLLLVALHVFR